jgi:hypothetical protein
MGIFQNNRQRKSKYKFLPNTFSENRAIYEICGKYDTTGQATDDDTIWRRIDARIQKGHL